MLGYHGNYSLNKYLIALVFILRLLSILEASKHLRKLSKTVGCQAVNTGQNPSNLEHFSSINPGSFPKT